MYLSLWRRAAATDIQRLSPVVAAIYVTAGTLVAQAGTLSAGKAGLFAHGIDADEGADWVGFVLHAMPTNAAPGLVSCHDIGAVVSPVVFRVDTVSFPPGAVAWRHVHPGPGIRYLTDGALRVAADDHAETRLARDAWFEPAHAPVRATALEGHPLTRFVRCMILPSRFLGQSTLTILDPSDLDRPRLQTTTRLLDHLVDTDAG